MSTDLVLRPWCGGCGSSSDLYGSNCKHMTLCFSCGKSMAQKKAKCYDCGATITRLIREYSVQVNNDDDKNYFIGRFPTATGLPKFSRMKKYSQNESPLCNKEIQDGLQGDKPLVLEDETGQSQHQGHLEQQSAAYYLLMQQGKEISAVPAASWFNFDKVAQYDKQLTLEEAEEKMTSMKKTRDAYQRWLMKATNGAIAFDKADKFGGKDSKNKTGFDDDDEGNISDKGDEDEEEEGARKNRLGLEKRGGDDEVASGDDDEGNISDKGDEDEEEEGARKNRLGLEKRGGDDDVASGDDDFINDDSEKGDDWELEEIFSYDDENNPEDTEDFAPEVPVPQELKQDDEEVDNKEEEAGLSEYGKELKKLLGRLNESDTEDIIDNSPSGSTQTTPSTSKPSKEKRKRNDDDADASSSAPPKKLKTEINQDQKPSVKEEHASASPVSEEEIRAVLKQKSPMYIEELIDHFPGRLESDEEKDALIEILKGIYSERLYKKPNDDEPEYDFVLRE